VELWPDYRNTQPAWTPNDVQSFIDYGFNVNSVIYAACMYRADAINSAQLRAYRGTIDKSEPVQLPDPLAMLLARPNQFQSAHEFHALNSVFFALAGQSFIWFVRDRRGGIPTAMYTLRPDWVKIVPSKEAGKPVVGYVYVPEGTSLTSGYPLLPEDMMHVKRPNPGDPLMGAGYGLSPLSAAAQSGNVDNDITKFLKVFFQSGAMFQNVVSFEGTHDTEDLARIREQLKERYGGVENWNEWAVFDSSAKVTRLSPTFDEMGFDAIDSRNEARILMALGVPPILVGSRFGLERSTYSNTEEARRAFWEDRLLPELKMFEGEFNYYLSTGDTFVRYDLSDVPALRRDIPALSVAAKTLYDMGVPARVAFTTVGLDVPEYEGDQDSKPAPVNPFGAITAPAQRVRLMHLKGMPCFI
jgi:HK97 family phage portal protein